MLPENERLFVHRWALTQINVSDDSDHPHLFPVVAVWADLTPLVDAGVPVTPDPDGVGMPVMWMVGSHSLSHDPATMEVLITNVDPGDVDEDVTLPPETPPERVWALSLPTAWVGAAMGVRGGPLQLRMMLLDGPPPPAPEHHLLDVSTAGIVLLPTVPGVSDTLARLMGAEWAYPYGVDPRLVVNLMRDQMWTLMAGMALGQERALKRTAAFTQWVSQSYADRDDDEAAARRWGQVAAAVDRISDLYDTEALKPFLTDGASVWPGQMAHLSTGIEELAPQPVVEHFVHGLAFTDAVTQVGVEQALAGFMLVAAATATHACTEGEFAEWPDRINPTLLLGVWLDDAVQQPVWALRATAPLLLHHDLDVLLALLSASPHPDEEVGRSLTRVFLHVIIEALMSFDLDAPDLIDQLGGLDYQPPNLVDMTHVLTSLLEKRRELEQADTEDCPTCVSVVSLMKSISDHQRLHRAAAGLLPLLADLDAELAGFEVGDEEWATRRRDWMGHWLTHATETVATEQTQ